MWKYVFIIDFVCENIFSFFIVDFGHSYVMEMSFRAKDNFEKKKIIWQGPLTINNDVRTNNNFLEGLMIQTQGH